MEDLIKLFTPITSGLFVILGIYVGNKLQRSGRWQKNEMAKIYSDCIYHSWRLQAALRTPEALSWEVIYEDLGECIRNGNLLFPYAKDSDWLEMSGILSNLQVYGLSFVERQDDNNISILKDSSKKLYNLVSDMYRYNEH